MQRRTLAVGAVVTLLVVATAAFVLGTGSERPDDSFPTGSGAGTGTTTPTGSDGTTTPATAPSFAFTIDQIENCGRTCRDVTSTLVNDGAAATNVTVYTRIYAGNGTDGNVVWRGQEQVGALDAGESYTTTKRVDLTLAGAIAVESAGGWITVQTTVQSTERTVTFTQRRQVG